MTKDMIRAFDRGEVVCVIGSSIWLAADGHLDAGVVIDEETIRAFIGLGRMSRELMDYRADDLPENHRHKVLEIRVPESYPNVGYRYFKILVLWQPLAGYAIIRRDGEMKLLDGWRSTPRWEHFFATLWEALAANDPSIGDFFHDPS